MSGRGAGLDLLYGTCRISHQHLGLPGLERRTIHRPILAVVIGQAFIGGEPGPVAIHAFDLIHEVTGQAAILFQEVMPVTAVITAGAEVSCYPEDLILLHPT